ncbi:MAG: carboxypeptidase-like regulatory domain-containing protein, partial [Bacteroidales bacterium]|nr:carboxypeptidase-like regulatory domain-containing protein [Bacteroidales bacterium]
MKKNLFVILFISFSSLLVAQSGSISGTVKDANSGEWLPGASIRVSGTTIGTITDLNGNFDLLGIPEGNQKIEFYFLGFALETREILIKKNESP